MKSHKFFSTYVCMHITCHCSILYYMVDILPFSSFSCQLSWTSSILIPTRITTYSISATGKYKLDWLKMSERAKKLYDRLKLNSLISFFTCFFYAALAAVVLVDPLSIRHYADVTTYWLLGGKGKSWIL